MVKFPDGKMKKYTKCKPLIKKYPVKCRELGDEDNVCCKSCDGVGEYILTFYRTLAVLKFG